MEGDEMKELVIKKDIILKEYIYLVLDENTTTLSKVIGSIERGIYKVLKVGKNKVMIVRKGDWLVDYCPSISLKTKHEILEIIKESKYSPSQKEVLYSLLEEVYEKMREMESRDLK
jgi:K+-transporting ATPase A subunit